MTKDQSRRKERDIETVVSVRVREPTSENKERKVRVTEKRHRRTGNGFQNKTGNMELRLK